MATCFSIQLELATGCCSGLRICERKRTGCLEWTSSWLLWDICGEHLFMFFLLGWQHLLLLLLLLLSTVHFRTHWLHSLSIAVCLASKSKRVYEDHSIVSWGLNLFYPLDMLNRIVLGEVCFSEIWQDSLVEWREFKIGEMLLLATSRRDLSGSLGQSSGLLTFIEGWGLSFQHTFNVWGKLIWRILFGMLGKFRRVWGVTFVSCGWYKEVSSEPSLFPFVCFRSE